MKKYSPSNNAFYDIAINRELPDDAIDITEKAWADLLDGQAKGKLITCGTDFRPCLTEQLAPTREVLIAQAEQKKTQLRIAVDSEINWRQDAVDTDIATEEEKNTLAELKKYRVMLMRVNIENAERIFWPKQPVNI